MFFPLTFDLHLYKMYYTQKKATSKNDVLYYYVLAIIKFRYRYIVQIVRVLQLYCGIR